MARNIQQTATDVQFSAKKMQIKMNNATRKSRTVISKPPPPLVTSGEFPTIVTSDNRKKLLTESLLKTGKSFAAVSHVPRSVALAARSSMRKTTNMTAFEFACVNQIIRTRVSQAGQQQQTSTATICKTGQQKEVSRSISKAQRTNRQRCCSYNQSLTVTISSRYCRYFGQNIYSMNDTNGTAPSSVDSRISRYINHFDDLMELQTL